MYYCVLVLTRLLCPHPAVLIPAVAPRFRGNFGFMFSFTGRTVFIIFCGTMLLALDMWLGWLVGIITIRTFHDKHGSSHARTRTPRTNHHLLLSTHVCRFAVHPLQ